MLFCICLDYQLSLHFFFLPYFWFQTTHWGCNHLIGTRLHCPPGGFNLCLHFYQWRLIQWFCPCATTNRCRGTKSSVWEYYRFLFIWFEFYFSGFNRFMFPSFMESIFFSTYLQLRSFLFHSLPLHSIFKSPLCFGQIDVFHYVAPVQRVTNISSVFWVFPVFEFWIGFFFSPGTWLLSLDFLLKLCLCFWNWSLDLNLPSQCWTESPPCVFWGHNVHKRVKSSPLT